MTLKEQLALKPTITITLLRTEGMNNGADLMARCGGFVTNQSFTEAEYQAMNDEDMGRHIDRMLKALIYLIASTV